MIGCWWPLTLTMCCKHDCKMTAHCFQHNMRKCVQCGVLFCVQTFQQCPVGMFVSPSSSPCQCPVTRFVSCPSQTSTQHLDLFHCRGCRAPLHHHHSRRYDSIFLNSDSGPANVNSCPCTTTLTCVSGW